MKIWDTTTFWGRVKEKTEKKGLLLKSLAEQVGLSPSTVFNYTNLNQIPKKKDVIEKMAYVLGTTTEYLLEGTNDNPTEELNSQEKRLLLYFQGLDDDEKQSILTIMRNLSCK